MAGGSMKVSDLAEELGVPASAVLEQCQRFGLDASWAGAELKTADVVVIRAELAEGSPPVERVSATEPSSALPPTAASSMPDLIDEITPEPTPEPTAMPGGIRLPGASAGGGPTADPDGTTKPTTPPKRVVASKPHLHRFVRNACIALGAGLVVLGVAELLRNPWAIGVAWLFAAIALVVSAWHAIRGWRRVTTHPDRHKGAVLAVACGVVAAGAAIFLGISASSAIGDEPAADAPLGLGERASVESARWGYQRLARVADNGWKRPAKEEGTCWRVNEKVTRDVDRIEVGNDSVRCERGHVAEIIEVYAFDRDADSPFPGVDVLQADAAKRCRARADRLLGASDDGAGTEGTLIAEHATEAGWAQADHDVACAVVTSVRNAPLG